MTTSLHRSAAVILAAFVVAGPAAVPAAAGEADLDVVAAGHGVSADELLDAVPYPPGAERAQVEAARQDKAERDRARAVATEFAAADDDDDDGGGADGAGIAARPKPDHEAQVAAAFSVEPAQVLALRDEGVGWGAIVKLHQIAHARNVPVGEVLAGLSRVDGEYQFDFGELRRQLSDEERARMMEKSRSVGAIRGQRPDHAGPSAKAERDAAKAERKAERDAAKAERKAERDAAKASRDVDEDDGDDDLEAGDEDDDGEAKGPRGTERGEPDKPGKDRSQGPDDGDEDDGGHERDDDEDD